MNHKTREIAIKKAQVDIGIIPLVDFLNGFDGIITRWSCEGYPARSKKVDLPYINFYAEDLQSIQFLLKELQSAPCTVHIQSASELISMSFAIRFENKEHLDQMIKWIKECFTSYTPQGEQ